MNRRDYWLRKGRRRANRGSGDLHVAPSFTGERDHESTRDCWCGPEVDYVAPSGARLWLHRREQ